MTDIARFGVSIPKDLVAAFDRQIERRGYTTRSEAIRDIIRDYLVEKQWHANKGEVVGTVTIVFDHERHDLTHVLTSLQHEFHDAIICSTHVHLDRHNCLEVIVVKGPGPKVNAIADRLISTKGVKHGKLACTTTGKNLS